MTETVLSQLYGCNMDLYFCGERPDTPHHEFGPSTRSHFLICLVTKGEATLFGREKNVTFGKGDFIIVFPDVPCHYRAGETWALKWVGVGSADLAVFLGRLGITPDAPIVPCSAPTEAEAILDKIRDLSTAPSPSRAMRMKGLLCDLVAMIAEEREKKNALPSMRSGEILNYISANYTEEIRVDQIARAYHLDRSYLERTFKRDTGLSIREAITDFRIKKAQSLLRETSVSVADVAKNSGFGDRLYFSKFFRKKFGMSPSEYRKISKQGGDRQQKDQDE